MDFLERLNGVSDGSLLTNDTDMSELVRSYGIHIVLLWNYTCLPCHSRWTRWSANRQAVLERMDTRKQRLKNWTLALCKWINIMKIPTYISENKLAVPIVFEKGTARGEKVQKSTKEHASSVPENMKTLNKSERSREGQRHKQFMAWGKGTHEFLLSSLHREM